MFTVRKNEYPSKQTVNLVFRERSINSPSRAIPAFLLFLVFLALFVRFGVQGQLQKMTSAQASLEKVQADLSGLVEYNRDYRVVEEGLVGRTTVFSDRMEPERCGIEHLLPFILSQLPLDYMVIMLGTNDTKARYHVSAAEIGFGMQRRSGTGWRS